MPRFLHSTAKLTRHLIHEMDDDPLEDMDSVNLGHINLDHLPMEGQSRVARGVRTGLRRGSISGPSGGGGVAAGLAGGLAGSMRKKTAGGGGGGGGTAGGVTATSDSQSMAEKAAAMASLKHIESAAQRIQEVQRGRASRVDPTIAAGAENPARARSSCARGSSSSRGSSRASQYVRGHDEISTDMSEGSEQPPEEDEGSQSPVGARPIQPWRLGMSIRDSSSMAAAPLRASEAAFAPFAA